ncbi:MAG TPA: alpha/beta hydrolase, partial [Acidimicrobiaceae bacterium]|nr:alpha/beta hydrolase [Acidimicrobiaceae bacterium]
MRRVEIQGADGLKLVADEWGDPSGPPVLMCHGAGQNRYAWKSSAEVLAERGWFVTTLDARGHGDSDWSPDQKYDSEDIGRDITAVLNTFDSPPAVVGASMGGMGSLAAQRSSESQLYTAVVLVDITPHFDMDGARKIIEFMSGHPEGFATLNEAADAISAYNPHRSRPSNPAGLSRVLHQRPDGRWIWRWDPAYVTSKPGFQTGDHSTLRVHMKRVSEIMTQGMLATDVPILLVRGGQSELVTAEAVKSFLDLVP